MKCERDSRLLFVSSLLAGSVSIFIPLSCEGGGWS